MNRRRTRLVAVGLALLALTGAYVAGNAGFASADHDVYSVRQNGQCYDVTPLGSGDQTVGDFYDYQRGAGTEYSSYGTTHLQENQVSRLFVYRGSGGTSLVMLHDQLDGEGGGAITFHVSGLPTDGDWAVVDDTYNESDDNFAAQPGSADIDWMWSDNRTDGAAFRGLEGHGYDAITIEPRFNEQSWAGSERQPRWPYADDQVSWQLLDADGSTIQLDRTSSVTIEPGPCQPTTTVTTTPAPTPSPTPDPTPTPTPTPNATPTPTPNATPTPTPTPTPTEVPTDEPTPEPTPTPDDSDDGNDGGSNPGSGSQSRNYGSNTGPDEESQQESLPEMSVDVNRPDDDTAFVEVADPLEEDSVEISPLVDDDRVSYRSLDLSFETTDDFEVSFRASEVAPPGTASPSPDRDSIEALSYLSVDREGLAAENVTGAQIAFAVDESTLDEHGVAPEEVAVYRRSDGEWQPVATELAGEDDGTYEYVARSSNLSSLMVAANRPNLAVTDVELAADAVRPGEEVEIRAIVENAGKAAGTATANFTAFGTVVDVGHVRVPAGETRTLVFAQRFDSPGEYTVAVDGVQAQVQVEATTPAFTESATTDPTTGPGQPGFGLLSAFAVVFLIGLVIVYGLQDLV